MTKRIQGYTLLQCVGKGSSGEVFRATHQSKQGQFAIKVIENKLLIENPKAEECLLNEVKVLSKIGVCEFIVSFHELIKTKKHHYYVYDYCNGGNLYQKLKKDRRIPENEVLKYLKAILRAYKTLNKYKVLHRDLKPENILFHNGKLKLADFGLCKGLQPEEYMTKTMLGSPIYMAPEILKGQSYTSKADIWSLGVITFEMLYGYCPYHSNSIAALSSKIQTSSLQLPEDPIVSTSTKQLLKKMLTKDYFRRIGWIQLFKQLLNCDEGDLKSVKSFYDVEELVLKQEQNIIRDKSKSKSNSKSRNSKKTSLCLIQCNSSVPNLAPAYTSNFQANDNSINNIPSPKYELQYQNQSQQKENRIGFSSSKYMAILNRSEELRRQPNKKSPKFFNEENSYQPTYSYDSSPVSVSSYYSPPIYYKDYPTLQKNNSAVHSNLYTNVPNTKIAKSPSENIYINYETNKNRAYYDPPKISSLTNKQTNIINLLKKGELKISANLEKEKEKKMKQFMLKLQKIHEQFVKIAPYCQNLLNTKNKQHINDILQFLHLLRSKLNYFRDQFSKIKKSTSQEHDDIETMISYQIIGIEQVIQKINTFNTNENGMSKKLSHFHQNYNQYTYKSISLEKASKQINQIFI